MSIKFGVIGDVHFNDKPDVVWNMFGQNEYRRFSTAATRMGNFVSTLNVESSACDFAIHTGDAIDSTGINHLTNLGNFNTKLGDLNCDAYNTIGNHVKWLVDTAEAMTWAQYFSTLTNQASQDNKWPDNDNPKAYTFDKVGFHCIVLLYTYLNYVEGEEGDDQLGWLEARLQATSLPVLVFCHAYLHTQMHQYGNPGYAYYGSDDTYLAPVRTVLEAGKNVQAVFCSHYHRAKSTRVINDIPYIGFAGSVHAPLANDNAYYIVEVTPNQVRGANQWRSAIKITGYGNKAWDLRMDKWLVA